MSPTTVFLFSIPAFVLTMCLPILALVVYSIVKKTNRLTGKQALKVWACLIIYYVVFFTQVPKITRPYFAAHSHQVTECTVRAVWDE